MAFWTVPRCFEGNTVAILASGPSLTEEVANKIGAAGLPAIAINNSFRRAPWAWMLYAADFEWWTHKANADVRKFSGHKATCTAGEITCPKIPEMQYLRISGPAGFDPDPSAVRTGGNSGYQAVHIAAHTGASRILLCGMDMHGCHWHGPHPHGMKISTPDLYERWMARFAALGKELEKLGIDVVNVTPDSRLDCFRRASLDSELVADHATRA